MSKHKYKTLSAMEERLINKGGTIVINHYLPDDAVIQEHPNKLFEKELTELKDCNADQTMSPGEEKVKIILGTVGIGTVMLAFIFMMVRGGEEKVYHAYKALKPKDVTEVKSTRIDEMTILQTNTADEAPKKNAAVFGTQKVEIGDKVSYENTNPNLVDAQGKNRNFNTPLLIVANAGRSYGGHSSNEKLPIPSNTVAYVYLERDLMTGNLDAPVTAVTYLDVKSNGKTVLPKGARLIGQCQSVSGNRIQINFENVIFPDGREYAVRGMALGEDNLVGVAGDINRNIAKKTGNLFASSLLDAAAQSMSITGDSFGSVFAGSMADKTGDSFDNVVDDSAERSGMTIKVAASTRFKVVFE